MPRFIDPKSHLPSGDLWHNLVEFEIETMNKMIEALKEGCKNEKKQIEILWKEAKKEDFENEHDYDSYKVIFPRKSGHLEELVVV